MLQDLLIYAVRFINIKYLDWEPTFNKYYTYAMRGQFQCRYHRRILLQLNIFGNVEKLMKISEEFIKTHTPCYHTNLNVFHSMGSYFPV